MNQKETNHVHQQAASRKDEEMYVSSVTLDHLLILLHLEVIEDMEKERKMLPEYDHHDNYYDHLKYKYNENDGNHHRKSVEGRITEMIDQIPQIEM